MSFILGVISFCYNVIKDSLRRYRKLTILNKIFIWAALATIISFVCPPINTFISYQYKKYLGKNPDTFIFIFIEGKEGHLENLNDLEPFNSKWSRGKITISPIQVPRDLKNVWVPFKVNKWTYPENAKRYIVIFENRGDDIDKNIKVKLNFDPPSTVGVSIPELIPTGRPSIYELTITNKERIKILAGGKQTSGFVDLVIPELIPKERQKVEIVTLKGNTPKVNAWSEKLGEINKIYIYGVKTMPK